MKLNMEQGGEPTPTVGGIRVFSIVGRMIDQRQRVLGMTDEERRWRAQFLKDQVLKPDEPRFSPEYYKHTRNIFVRLTRIPLDIFERALAPIVGAYPAAHIRFFTGKLIVMYLFACGITYNLKYHSQDWTRIGGWYVIKAKPTQVPGDPNFPYVPKHEKHEYADLGFSKSEFF